MKKKFLMAVMVITLLISAFGIMGVSAATYGDLTYTVSDKKVTITDCNTSATGDLVIPAKINNYPVTTIGNDAFYNCTGITSVTIPNSVTLIGSMAFADCDSLTSVTIPDSVTVIGGNAFNGCIGLTSMTIPDSVTSIGGFAFSRCTGLAKVNITDLKAWCEIEFSGYDSNPLCCAKNLYLNGNLITDLVIPNSVTSIGNYAFDGCSGLTSITIPKSVTSIGQSAFSNCTGLISITIPDSVTNIGVSAFRNCTGLTSITIPGSVTSIGDDAFYYCTGLTKVNITDLKAWCEIKFLNELSNPLYYAKKLYLNSNLVTDLVIPNGTTTIGDYAFCKCTDLTSVTIPDSVTSIGTSAFEDCAGLTSVTIPDSVTSIGTYAFDNCYGLTKVNITDLKAWCEIEFGDLHANPLCYAKKMYLNGKKTTDLEIPNGTTKIGNYAFCDYAGLTSVIIPNSVTTIGISAFLSCTGLTSVTIPDSVTSIGDNVFCDCSNIVSVTIGDGVEKISERAFWRCSNLKSVAIGNGVKYIRNDAFNGCSKLETVFYEGSEAEWNEILFYNRNENLTNAKIVYNATKKTYKFVTNCGATLNNITDYAVVVAPSVENEGKTLTGWYDNASLSGSPVTFPYYGSATTLYAGWTDRTGKTFDDAIMANVNHEYSATTTESGQMIYYEFVPSYSKTYKIYSTGGKDTYGYLYNSSKSQLTYNDDSGDGNNFSISYNLTAGEKYYIGAKVYNGYGTFGIYIEEPVDYRINEITISDNAGNNLTSIPNGNFLATVSFTNVSASADTVIVLARYTSAGVFDGLMYIRTTQVPTGSTIMLSIPVDNTDGNVAKLKAFCLESFGSATPMGNSVTFPADI